VKGKKKKRGVCWGGNRKDHDSNKQIKGRTIDNGKGVKGQGGGRGKRQQRGREKTGGKSNASEGQKVIGVKCRDEEGELKCRSKGGDSAAGGRGERKKRVTQRRALEERRGSRMKTCVVKDDAHRQRKMRH